MDTNLHSTVTKFLACVFFRFVEDVFVVTLDDTFDVFCAAVTDFNGVTVEDFVEFVMLREVFGDKM